MDRGIPTEELLEGDGYLAPWNNLNRVGTPRSKVRQYEKKWLDLPWQKVRKSVDVKLFTEDGELYVLAKSEGRRAKERAMRRKKLARLLRKLRAMQRSGPRRDQLLLRIGAARKEVGSAFRFLHLKLPSEGQAVTRHSFQFRVDSTKAPSGGAAGRPLFAPFEPRGRGSRGALGALYAAGTNRGGL